jgi:hypothetical protein
MIRFPLSTPYNFMQYPEQWSRDEWNNHVHGCIVNGRDLPFCQMLSPDDCVSFQFAAATKGDNLIEDYVTTVQQTTGVTPFKVVKSAFNFSPYQVGDLILNNSTGTGSSFVGGLISGSANIADDIFLTSPQGFRICKARTLIAPNWKPSLNPDGDLVLRKVSDVVNDSQVQIVRHSDLVVGKIYKLTLSVEGFAGGNAFVQFGSNIVGYIYGSGTYNFYGQYQMAGGVTIASLAASNFIGGINISKTEMYELETEYTLVWMEDVPTVLGGENESFVLNPATGIVRYENCELAAGLYGQGYKCLYFGLLSGCQSGRIVPECSSDGWTFGINAYWDGDQCAIVLEETKDPGELIAQFLSDCIVTGQQYTVAFTISGLVGTISFTFGGNTTVISANGNYSYTGLIADFNDLIFTAMNADTAVIISNVNIIQEVLVPEYVSECFTLTEDCSIQLKFRNDSNVFGYDYTDGRYFNYIRLCGRLRRGQLMDNDYVFFKNTLSSVKTVYADVSRVREFFVNLIPPYLIEAVQCAFRHNELYLNDQRITSIGDTAADYNDNTELGKIECQIALYDQSNTWAN